MTTQSQDEVEKKHLYESIGVTEYWQFDPRGEWIPEKLRGYRLPGELEPVQRKQLPGSKPNRKLRRWPIGYAN
jgi:Uma2 family endonuclease